MNTIQPLPNFETAKANLPPEDYKRFLKALALSDLTLEGISSELNRSLLTNTNKLQVDITREIRLRQEDVNHPQLLLDYDVRTLVQGQEMAKIGVTYCLHFATTEELPADFFAIYGSTSADMQAWPFLRELINSLTSSMGIPRLFLPVLTNPTLIRQASTTSGAN